MPKVHILVGIPGSGKSTYAREIVKQGSCIRVNRDDIRLMLASKWHGKLEDVVIDIEKSAVRSALKKGYGVVIDDTNLTEKTQRMWSVIAGEADAKVETYVFRTTLQTCVERDKERARTSHRHEVGEAVIQRFAMRSGLYNLDFSVKDKTVFVDIDGTIADLEHRVHLLDDKSDRDRWAKFFARADEDLPIQFVIDWVKELYRTHHVIIVSGRAWDLCGDITIEWLKRHEVPYDRILMRTPRDKRPDTETKKEILDEYLMHHPKESIDFVIDDRLSVIRMWKANGLRVIPVGTWREFE